MTDWDERYLCISLISGLFGGNRCFGMTPFNSICPSWTARGCLRCFIRKLWCWHPRNRGYGGLDGKRKAQGNELDLICVNGQARSWWGCLLNRGRRRVDREAITSSPRSRAQMFERNHCQRRVLRQPQLFVCQNIAVTMAQAQTFSSFKSDFYSGATHAKRSTPVAGWILREEI